MKKKNKQNINGIIVLDKPIGKSSNYVLQKVKWMYNAKKAGHTGTLDPLATGVLPICFGKATKIAQYLLDSDKRYLATIKLGQETTTYDSEGDIVNENEVGEYNISYINELLDGFRGLIEQTPPIYSAIKHNGQPLYKLARKGETIAIKSRQVNIYDLNLIQYDKDMLTIDVTCSKGTYIRSLANDIGSKLGCGGHLISLQRTKSSIFDINQSIKIEDIDNMSMEDKINSIITIEHVFFDKEKIVLNGLQLNDFINKSRLELEDNINGLYRIYDDKGFIAVAEFENGNLVQRNLFEREVLSE